MSGRDVSRDDGGVTFTPNGITPSSCDDDAPRAPAVPVSVSSCAVSADCSKLTHLDESVVVVVVLASVVVLLWGITTDFNINMRGCAVRDTMDGYCSLYYYHEDGKISYAIILSWSQAIVRNHIIIVTDNRSIICNVGFTLGYTILMAMLVLAIHSVALTLELLVARSRYCL